MKFLGRSKFYFYCGLIASLASSAAYADPALPMAAWKLLYFTPQQIAEGWADDEAKPAGDDTTNLMKYALGLSPWESPAPFLPIPSVTAGHLTLQYRRPASVADLLYTVEASSDLKLWESGPTVTSPEEITSLGQGFILVTQSDLKLTSSEPRRFLRLNITRMNPDADNDGLPDDWEIKHFNTLFKHGSSDEDSDGITNQDESSQGLDPLINNTDSDGDGLLDQVELTLGTNLNARDSDGDSLIDGLELQYGSDPLWEDASIHVKYVVRFLPFGFVSSDMNDLGQVVGYENLGNNIFTGFFIDLDSNETVLIDELTWARSVNNEGLVLGTKDDASVILWNQGVMGELGSSSVRLDWITDDSKMLSIGFNGSYFTEIFSFKTSSYRKIGGDFYNFVDMNRKGDILWKDSSGENRGWKIIRPWGRDSDWSGSWRSTPVDIANSGTVLYLDEDLYRWKIRSSQGINSTLPLNMWLEVSGYYLSNFINSNDEIIGQIVESINHYDYEHGIWRPDVAGGWTFCGWRESVLNHSGNLFFEALKINDRGEVMGFCQDIDPDTNTFRQGYAVLIPLKGFSLQVDYNTDGILTNTRVDRTSAERPCRFWLNDDDDQIVDASVPGLYSEIEDDDRALISPANEDWRDNIIDTPRDLEDFARIHLYTQGLTDAFRNGELFLGLKWADTTGTPAIKLYRSRDTTGSSSYLFNTSAAAQQEAAVAIVDARHPGYSGGNFESDHTLIESTTEAFVIPSAEFSASLGNGPTRPFLFEGCKAGKGQLKIVILKKEGATYTEIGEGPGVWLDLKRPHEFIERFTCGDGDLQTVGALTRHAQSATFAAPATDEEKDYVLYVHGYNMDEFEKQRWIETTFKRLHWLGYKGRVGGFTWPCTQSFVPYDESEERAWESAVRLREHLANLKAQGYRVHMLAHSQGNVVAGEALRQWKELGNTIPLVRTYIASQAAIQAHCYDASAPLIPYFEGSLSDDGTPNVYVNYAATNAPYLASATMNGAAGKWVNFHNPRDYALTGNGLEPGDNIGWQADQRLKPDAGSGMGYSPTYWFYRVNSAGDIIPLSIPADRFKIFSYLAEGRSVALGSTATGGVFSGNNTDLEATLGYSRHHRFHSGQFRSFMSERYDYWRRLMLGIGLQPFTP